MLGPMLLTWHNLAYYQRLMRGLRQAIIDQSLEQFAENARSGWRENAGPADTAAAPPC
jgi:queuine tRNA-ribosyltransferase